MKSRSVFMVSTFIGILSSLLIGCKTVDNAHYEEYHFINQTNDEMVIQSYTRIDEEYALNEYSIFENDTLTQEIELVFGSITGIIAFSDSVRIIYDNEKTMSFLPESSSTFNILNRERYMREEISKNHVKYQYIFTQSDFDNAEPIE